LGPSGVLFCCLMPISLNHEPSPHIGSRSQKSGPHAWQGPTLAAVRTQNSSDHDGTALVVNLVCLRNDTYAVGSMAVLDGCVAGADDTVMTESSAPEPTALPGPGVSLASTCFSQASPPFPRISSALLHGTCKTTQKMSHAPCGGCILAANQPNRRRIQQA
jgi:hypothetical protein